MQIKICNEEKNMELMGFNEQLNEDLIMVKIVYTKWWFIINLMGIITIDSYHEVFSRSSIDILISL